MRYFLVFFSMSFCIPAVTAQTRPHKNMVSLDSLFHDRPVPVSKWTLSLNPLGLLEFPGAAGVGIGYRWNDHVELWSESSFLFNGVYHPQGPVTGIRQILQGKYFLRPNSGIFAALEVRYKSYQYRDSLRFVNDATHDTLYGFSTFSRHYFWGAALQLGWRTKLSSRLQLELTAGIGARKVTDIWNGVPPGYKHVRYRSIDLNVYDIIDENPDFYLPGSVRLIWLFGKRLRP